MARENKLEAIRMLVPPGWSAAYDAAHDTWQFTAGEQVVRFERAPASVVASPEALRHYLETKVWAGGTTADIDSRASLSDGYATTFAVHAATDPSHPVREAYVIKQLGNEWFQCVSRGLADDVMRDTVLALCKSLKR